tara:strand:- start:1600 stop:2112 length:513 start_codon:yes stop_codon:yes gene_type:complete
MTSFMKKVDDGSVMHLPFETEGFGQFVSFDKTVGLAAVCEPSQTPRCKTPGAAGLDVCASEDATVPSRGSCLVGTGVRLQIPEGYYGKIEGRSGLAFRQCVMPFGGVIDSDYRGEIKVLLLNHSDTAYEVGKGDAMAQIILHKHESPTVFRVETLDDTARGADGFGSTGL